MSRLKTYSIGILVVLLVWFFSDIDKEKEQFSERVKISLREIGNQLLLSNQDATSLVLPIIELEESMFKLSFQNQLSFEPGSLVSIVDKSFQKSSLSLSYRVAVMQCADGEIAYSYEMNGTEESSIIPCVGRVLPKACYTIEVRFIDRAGLQISSQTITYITILLVLFVLELFYFNRKPTEKPMLSGQNYVAIGSFSFYQEQNKLVKNALEISLSNKECELLAIFVAHPNHIIKRDELTKKVWEDNGVFVGRSLDTYISKLRKKLKEDDSIKLINVHGVGYKLEINT